ncbi:unnamed protein product [Rotaria sp. Silwood1]|nr:unnamed protein product [Rotaria sp. Silwood1]CAF0996267.1 unnamed protein product [Rotaria sp. Silwood1]
MATIHSVQSSTSQSSNQLRLDNEEKETDAGDSERKYTNQKDLDQHQLNYYDSRSIKCSFCQELQPSSSALSAHLMLCGNKTDKCPNCRKFIRRAIFAYHYENNCANLEETDTPIPRFRDSSAHRHSSKSNRPASRQNDTNDHDQEDGSGYISPNSRTIPLNEISSSALNKIRPSANRHRNSHDIVYIPCEICNEQIDLRYWSPHTQDCREQEIRRIEALAETINRKSVTEKLPCEYCEELLAVEQLRTHETICRKNPDNIIRATKLIKPQPLSTVALTNKSLKTDKDPTLLLTYSSLQPTLTPAYNYSSLSTDIRDRINDRERTTRLENGHASSHVNINVLRTNETLKLRHTDISPQTFNEQSTFKQRRATNGLDLHLINSSRDVSAYDTLPGLQMSHRSSSALSLSNRIPSATSFERKSEYRRPMPRLGGLASIDSSHGRSASTNFLDARGSTRSYGVKVAHHSQDNNDIAFHSPRIEDRHTMANEQLTNRNRQEMSTNNESNSIQNSDKSKNAKSSKGISIPIQIVSSITLGIIFGFLMNKANIYLAPMIREQMLFTRLAMIKMFLAAVGTSMLTVVVVILINESTYRSVFSGFVKRNERINAFQLVLGGSLIGVGMVLAGSCPGTIFVQIGSGLRNSLITSLGAICGVLFYYLFLNKHLTKHELPKSSIVLQQLPDLIGIKRIYLNLIFGVICISIAFILEYFVPYKYDLMKLSGLRSVQGWSPVLCGIGIGLLQLFFMILFQKSLGISTGFSVLVAQICRVQFFKQLIPSLESFTYGIQNSLTLLFAFGAIAGSFISTVLTHQFPLNEKYGANAWNSFFGGFLLLVGARCAGGCTSGQGISGVSHLLIGSLIATAAMFGGGILFAISYGLITNDWQFHAL